MSINEVILIVCAAIAISAVCTSFIVASTQKRKEEANKKLNASQILMYSAELTSKISNMLKEYHNITTAQYESDSQLRGHCINKTVSIITQTLAEHGIMIPVDPDVLQSLAILLVEKAIAAIELKQSTNKCAALATEVENTKAEVAKLTSNAYTDKSYVEKVDLGEFN